MSELFLSILQLYCVKERALGSRELMAPLIKCLPHKQKDLSLNPKHPCKIMGTGHGSVSSELEELKQTDPRDSLTIQSGLLTKIQVW